MQVNQLIAQGQWYRLVSCTFLHGNLLHLFTNCQAREEPCSVPSTRLLQPHGRSNRTLPMTADNEHE